MMGFIDFINEKGIRVIGGVEKLEADGITDEVYPLLSDQDKLKYFPRIGDRILLQEFCSRKKLSHNVTPSNLVVNHPVAGPSSGITGSTHHITGSRHLLEVSSPASYTPPSVSTVRNNFLKKFNLSSIKRNDTPIKNPTCKKTVRFAVYYFYNIRGDYVKVPAKEGGAGRSLHLPLDATYIYLVNKFISVFLKDRTVDEAMQYEILDQSYDPFKPSWTLRDFMENTNFYRNLLYFVTSCPSDQTKSSDDEEYEIDEPPQIKRMKVDDPEIDFIPVSKAEVEEDSQAWQIFQNSCSNFSFSDQETEAEPEISENSVTAGSRNNITELERSNVLMATFTQMTDRIVTSRKTVINVNRTKLNSGDLQEFFRPYNRPSFVAHHVIDVRFGEGEVNVGGPQREYFTLGMRALQFSERIFEGPINKRILKVVNGEEDLILCRNSGIVMSLSFVNRGPSPCFLDKRLYENLLSLNETNPYTLEDVNDSYHKAAFQRLKDANSVDTIAEILRYEFPGSPSFDIIKIEDKSQIIDDLLQWYFHERLQNHLNAFRQGLGTLGFFDAVERNPAVFETFFCQTDTSDQDLKSDAFIGLFDVVYTAAEVESNEYVNERSSYVYFKDFLLECEEKTIDIPIRGILFFATSSKDPPAMGFPTKPLIKFHDKPFPDSSTCGPTLILPRIHMNYETFREKLIFALKNCSGFGKA